MNKSAMFSDDRSYRYHLFRQWDEKKPLAMCIGLNPSNADESEDDPTIRNLCKLLESLDYGGFYMCNVFACVTSDPKKIQSFADPVKINDYVLKDIGLQVKDVFFCWGSFKQVKYRIPKLVEMFPGALVFGKTAKGSPLHPLAATVWMKSKVKIEKY